MSYTGSGYDIYQEINADGNNNNANDANVRNALYPVFSSGQRTSRSGALGFSSSTVTAPRVLTRSQANAAGRPQPVFIPHPRGRRPTNSAVDQARVASHNANRAAAQAARDLRDHELGAYAAGDASMASSMHVSDQNEFEFQNPSWNPSAAFRSRKKRDYAEGYDKGGSSSSSDVIPLRPLRTGAYPPSQSLLSDVFSQEQKDPLQYPSDLQPQSVSSRSNMPAFRRAYGGSRLKSVYRGSRFPVPIRASFRRRVVARTRRLKSYGGRKVGARKRRTSTKKRAVTSRRSKQGDTRSGAVRTAPTCMPMKIKNSEYIGDITTSTGFTSESFFINPGIATVFPWLSGIASQFQEYKFRSLSFEYRTMMNDSINTAHTNTGTVVMACNYNVRSNGSNTIAYSNKQDAENSGGAVSAKPSRSCTFKVETNPHCTPLGVQYVRSNNTGYADSRFDDLGLFQIIITNAQTTGDVAGELWAHYDVDLMKPILQDGLAGFNVLSDHAQLKTVTNAAPLGTTSIFVPGCSLGGSIANGRQYVFPALIQQGQFLCTIFWTGSAVSFVAPVVTPTNCTFQSLWVSDADSVVSAPSTGVTSDTNGMFSFVISIAPSVFGASAVVTFGTAGTLPGTSVGDLFMTQLNTNITS